MLMQPSRNHSPGGSVGGCPKYAVCRGSLSELLVSESDESEVLESSDNSTVVVVASSCLSWLLVSYA